MSASNTPGNPPVAAPAVKKVRVPPSAEQVNDVLLKAIGHIPLVQSRGDTLQFLCMNGHFLDRAKAERLELPFMQLVRRAHMVFFQETNVDAIRYLARKARYGLNASHRNVRQQACGLLFHPRMQWLGDAPTYHDYLCDVPGHPEYAETLRPAVQRRVVDQWSGFTADAIDMHAKSNIGEEQTRDIRRWQFQSLVDKLAEQRAAESAALSEHPDLLPPTILGCDFNAPIENPATTETEPLLKAGFNRVSMPDNRWSYRYFEKGGQFDGFFVRGLESHKVECFIPEFFTNGREAAFMREVSDHLPVFMIVHV
jgi:hypothetical protein